jgi:isopentenyldiphosphate isomerase
MKYMTTYTASPELWEILDINGNPTGRLHQRGKPMNPGDYHLTVSVWIVNDKGEYLISQRTPNKSHPGKWECTGGNAVAGHDSLTTALKEANEELSITLQPQNGQIIHHKIRKCPCNHCLADIWLFRQNIDISTVTLAPDETNNVMWATPGEINRMVKEGAFATWEMFTDINELFEEN